MRRRFLIGCGKFAAVTPPAIALILAESNRNYAMALSGGSHGHGGGFGHGGRFGHGGPGDHWEHRHHFADNGFGNGGHDGVPGHSGASHGPQREDKVADSRR
jgi:hypothetical protein